MLDMLTADTASRACHEGPSPPAPNTMGSASAASAASASFLAQIPLAFLGSVLRQQAPSPAPSTCGDAPSTGGDAPSAAPTPAPAASPLPQRMASGPNTPTASPAPSRRDSTSTVSTDDRKIKKPRPKTIYNFAQPPPIAGPHHKLHLRPKVLLQLHQVVAGRRPKPAYEVIPRSLLAPRSTRRLARTFPTRERLCPTDLLVVKAETYKNSQDDDKSDDERWGARDVIGLICPVKKGDKDPNSKTTLLMDDGSSWEVTNMANGGYEFTYIDEHGLTFRRRWIPKTPHLHRTSIMSSNATQAMASPGLGPEHAKFHFSTITANSRRHPIIASMTRTSINVLDSYRMPLATSPPTPGTSQSAFGTPLATPIIIDSNSFLDKGPSQLPIKTDEALARFILLSGIWVAFSENNSPAFAWSKHISQPYQLSPSGTSRPAPNRSVSMPFIDSPRSVSPASTIDENHSTRPKLFRSGTQKLNPKPSFRNSTSTSTTTTQTTPSTSPIKTRPRRAHSTGNADLNRYNGSTRKHFSLPFEGQSLVETEEERQSKSVKELYLPDTPCESPDVSPAPVASLQTPPDPMFLSPVAPNPSRTRKTQSAYNPITTAGLWDSGVVDGRGVRSRPTSMVVVQDKKDKARRKQEKAQEKEYKERKPSFKERFLGIFRK